ncbi:MAG: MarR family transcriptional regulator [Ignavibacterium sp.]|nr:MAG: MarR family transcriptional regulator [Ignavibacterium sp.]
MGKILSKRLKQKKFESAEQEAVLNILVASSHIKSKVESACARFGISLSQFNVLRILNGTYPEGYPRGDIISRMIEPAPDVTRLIDRLIKASLVERYYSSEDRRLSLARITKKGQSLLKRIKPEIDGLNSLVSNKLNNTESKQLSALLEKIYAGLF